MTGPVQLLVLGFAEPRFSGEILAELDRLAESDLVRLIDAVVIQKDAEGAVSVLEEDGNGEDGNGPGTGTGAVATLIGLAEAEAAALEPALPPDAAGADAWSVDDVLPAGTAAAIALIEHRWAAGLRDAITEANGTLLADTWVNADDLDLIGITVKGTVR